VLGQAPVYDISRLSISRPAAGLVNLAPAQGAAGAQQQPHVPCLQGPGEECLVSFEEEGKVAMAVGDGVDGASPISIATPAGLLKVR
jgi:hypothetical protein